MYDFLFEVQLEGWILGKVDVGCFNTVRHGWHELQRVWNCHSNCSEVNTGNFQCRKQDTITTRRESLLHLLLKLTHLTFRWHSYHMPDVSAKRYGLQCWTPYFGSSPRAWFQNPNQQPVHPLHVMCTHTLHWEHNSHGCIRHKTQHMKLADSGEMLTQSLRGLQYSTTCQSCKSHLQTGINNKNEHINDVWCIH